MNASTWLAFMPARQLREELTLGVYSAPKDPNSGVPCTSAARRSALATMRKSADLIWFSGRFLRPNPNPDGYGHEADRSSSWLFTPRADRNLLRRVLQGSSHLESSNSCAEFQIRNLG
jgi:hypothetical protein